MICITFLMLETVSGHTGAGKNGEDLRELNSLETPASAKEPSPCLLMLINPSGKIVEYFFALFDLF